MIEADGVVLSLQRDKARKAEVKLGITYEGRQKIGKDRYSTVNKTLFADMATPARFWAGMVLKLHRKYDLTETQYISGRNDANWIKEGVDYFAGQYQLCRYHLNHALCQALGREREMFHTVHGYWCNAAGLKDYRETMAQPDGNLWITGAIKGNIDKLIVRRMKNRGMRCSLRGI